MKPTSNLINPTLPTIPGTSVMPGISSLVRVLAKALRSGQGTPFPLRYGNRAQAEKKRESLANRLSQDGSSSAVVQVESRFLIAIFPAEYDLDLKSGELIAKAALRDSLVRLEKVSDQHEFCRRRPLFATVSGPRINPRNRHNQNGAGPVY